MYRELLERNIKEGQLTLVLPGGDELSFGSHGPKARWLMHRPGTIEKIARDPEFQLGETYIAGCWDAGENGLLELLRLLRRNFSQQPLPLLTRWASRALHEWNHLAASLRNVSAHYDHELELFESFLDGDMHYSCAYFEHPDADLEAAQQAKCRHIAAKLMLKPGQRVLDIGCGWGGFARYLAQHESVEVTGITLSKQQLEYARARAQTQGLDGINFELVDYRKQRGSFDRIVSIGMFEHVGRPYYASYFSNIRRLLNQKGVALVHSIGRSGAPESTNAWIRKHIFPGGSIPALSEMSRATERAGLVVTDLEVLRLHYAYTITAWFKRFQAHRKQLSERFGERYCRIWEFYLASCDASFRFSDLVVFQQQLAKENDAVPITRDYLYRPAAAD